MVELISKSPFEGLLPLSIGALNLSEVEAGPLTSLAAYSGKTAAVSKALKTAHGMAAPAPNRATGDEGARALWFGPHTTLLMGPHPDPELSRHAALTDQSDAWACMRLEGSGTSDVLARLTTIDLRDDVFQPGHTARTELRHMMASLTRVSTDAWMILVFRSFAETVLHDLRVAMQSVTAR